MSSFTTGKGQETPQDDAKLLKEINAAEQAMLQLYQQGKYSDAAKKGEEALKLTETLYPKDKYPDGHPHLATSIQNLATMYYTQGSYAKAEPLFAQAAMKMREALYPKDKYPDGHRDLAMNLYLLALLCQTQGKYTKAEPLAERALAMCEKLYPKNKFPDGHRDLTASVVLLSYLYHAMGNDARG